jgi:hypothetical protein
VLLSPVGREPSAAAPTHLLRGGVAAWVPVVTVPGETRWGLDRHRRASSDAVISPRGAEVHKTPRLCNSFAMALEALFGRFGGKEPATGSRHNAISLGTATDHWWPITSIRRICHEKQGHRLI